MKQALSLRLATVALASALAVAASAVAAPPVVTAGVSAEERDALLERAEPYNLLLVFAEEGTGRARATAPRRSAAEIR